MSRSGARYDRWGGWMGSAPAAGFWWPPGARTTVTQGNGVLQVARVMLPPCRIVSLCFEVTTAATTGGLGRPVLYAEDASGLPSSLLADPGTASTETTGAKRVVLPTPYVHPGGPLWVGYAAQGGPTTQAVVNCYNQILPAPHTTLTGAGSRNGWQVGGVTGAAPATFPIGSASLQGATPYVWLEVG
jgi:hypothetical protein